MRSDFNKVLSTQHKMHNGLEAVCSILEDETNKNQLADDFIASCIEDLRQLRTY